MNIRIENDLRLRLGTEDMALLKKKGAVSGRFSRAGLYDFTVKVERAIEGAPMVRATSGTLVIGLDDDMLESLESPGTRTDGIRVGDVRVQADVRGGDR